MLFFKLLFLFLGPVNPAILSHESWAKKKSVKHFNDSLNEVKNPQEIRLFDYSCVKMPLLSSQGNILGIQFKIVNATFSQQFGVPLFLSLF